MKNFVGIDLGTTNSAIASFDGQKTKIWKSPEQNDITPSAIYLDRRGNKLVGQRAYEQAARSPSNSAVLFKRLMGTSTPIEFKAVNEVKTPEQCSAEVLKTLYGYLNEELRLDPETGVVITVPAAFNQMQKDATVDAANLAGINNVALMQEPVAAVMSVMKEGVLDGTFLVYDLGGGTLDIAIAESHRGKVNLLSHGGIAMCGGRDFDRLLMDKIVKPWLRNNFNLPDNFLVDPKYSTVVRMANYAAERAKIELSSKEAAVISLSETEIREFDLDGEEMYLDIEISRDEFDHLINNLVLESVEAAREALSKAHLTPDYIERVVFVGGPTNYKPLRDKVCFELGIKGSTEVNPMTAVAEGASIFAESIDWTTQNRERKSSRGVIESKGALSLVFKFQARTPNKASKIAIKFDDYTKGYEYQVDSISTGWTSGRVALEAMSTITVPLGIMGENLFKVFVFDPSGNTVAINDSQISITKTSATVEAIPASHSISIEALSSLGGKSSLSYLVKSGDSLPVKGTKMFKAAETLRAGTDNSINIKLWEGDIEDPVTDNRPVGVLKISGHDFEVGVVPAGADIECIYEIFDSGAINLEVSIPCIGGVFNSGKNFYSRQENQINHADSKAIISMETNSLKERVSEIRDILDTDEINRVFENVVLAEEKNHRAATPEESQEAMEKLLEAKRQLSKVRSQNLSTIRALEFDKMKNTYSEYIEQYAEESDHAVVIKLMNTAQNAIASKSHDFEVAMDELRSKNFEILYKQDWFVVEQFKVLCSEEAAFIDNAKFNECVQQGIHCIENNNIDELRTVNFHLFQNRVGGVPDLDSTVFANIVES